jgi:NADH:ubiquinone oxidoreductase subunit F (NADH-binding)/(2Fe-2S) ferredoxin
MAKLTVDDLKRLREEAKKSTILGESGAKVKITVHMGTCGLAAGAQDVMDVLLEEIELTDRQDIYVMNSGCAGMCSSEPNVTVEVMGHDPVIYQDVDRDKMRQIFKTHTLEGEVLADFALARIPVSEGHTAERSLDEEPSSYESIPAMKEHPFYAKQMPIVLRNRGIMDPEKIDEYIARDGYRGVEKALLVMEPEEIIAEMKKSGLRGRGGAGFPTGMKWEFAKNAQGDQKYVLCNADEGDPGAFMDRNVLEGDPHAVLEGMIIAAKAIGASKGYIYCRAEYPLALRRLDVAIKQAKEYGLLGTDILGSGFDLDIEVYQGAGAFVCGEETALMRSIEGKRGMPRPRPPFPAQKGLFDKPTVLNNVETYANVGQIIHNGGDWYSSIGTETSKGTKVFALTGDVNNIGLVEVPMGTTLRTIIYEIGGGIPKKRKFKAVQLGGPSGGCVPEEHIDTPVDYESITKVGAIMGSGGMIVMNDHSCMVDMARFFMDFIQDESCGKCTPCREGTKQMLKILEKITSGNGEDGDIEQLEELSRIIKDSALCGLGQTAPNPVLSTLTYFRDEYEAHIYEKRCPAKRCQALVKFVVNVEECIKCGLCAKNCPVEAIQWKKKEPAFIDKTKCIKCMSCILNCPADAID